MTEELWIAVGAAGWDELYNKQKKTGTTSATAWRSRMNNSMRDQHICHQGFAPFEAEWNYERWSPNNGLAAKIASLCK